MFKRRNKTNLTFQQQLKLRAALNDWFKTPLGRLLLEREQEHINSMIPNLFGYHLLQVGQLADVNLLEQSRIPHCSIMDMDQHLLHKLDHKVCSLGGLAEQWPIQTDCVDVIVLPHVLEYSVNPHQVLREVDRALIAEGHVVILGFNPWSLWGLWRLLLKPWKKLPWRGRFFSITRVTDWLSLLGFELVYCQSYLYRPPVQRVGIMRRLRFIENLSQRFCPYRGGGYMLVAKKKVTTLMPVKPRWRPGGKIRTIDVVETSMKGLNRE
jgi:SAM-dependent methyltransferase